MHDDWSIILVDNTNDIFIKWSVRTTSSTLVNYINTHAHVFTLIHIRKLTHTHTRTQTPTQNAVLMGVYMSSTLHLYASSCTAFLSEILEKRFCSNPLDLNTRKLKVMHQSCVLIYMPEYLKHFMCKPHCKINQSILSSYYIIISIVTTYTETRRVE